MRRKCSWRDPERMTERLTGVGAWDGEHEQVCVQFDEHGRLLSGSGHRTCETSVRGINGSGCAPGRPAASAVAGLVMSRTPRPRVAKLIDQRLSTSSRFWKPTK